MNLLAHQKDCGKRLMCIGAADLVDIIHSANNSLCACFTYTLRSDGVHHKHVFVLLRVKTEI